MTTNRVQPTTAVAPISNGKPERTASNSVVVRMAQRFEMDPIAFERTVKATCMPNGGKDVSNEQFAAFLIVADRYGLNPILKEIHAFSGRGGGVVPIVGVDGWYTLANRNEHFDGHTQRPVHDDELGLGIETTIYRKDRTHPTTHTEWLRECKRPTEPWKMEMRMLGHKSFIQTARAAFGFAGIYDPDEGERIADAQVVARVVETSVANLDALTQQLATENAQVQHGEAPPAEVDPDAKLFDLSQPVDHHD